MNYKGFNVKPYKTKPQQLTCMGIFVVFQVKAVLTRVTISRRIKKVAPYTKAGFINYGNPAANPCYLSCALQYRTLIRYPQKCP